MKIISLQSGSNGNCIYVESAGTRLIFDAGISGAKAKTRLAERQIDISSVDGLFISHDHSDHSDCMGILHRKFGIPVWVTQKTHQTVLERKNIGNIEKVTHFRSGHTIKIKDLTIETVSTPHDAADGVFFIVDDGAVRFGIMTDLGHVFHELEEAVKTVDAMVLESNYDPVLLANCDYPEYTKSRIAGNNGHISNHEAATLIQSSGKRLRWVCLGHISEHSNNTSRLMQTHKKVLKDKLPIHIASREGCSKIFQL